MESITAKEAYLKFASPCNNIEQIEQNNSLKKLNLKFLNTNNLIITKNFPITGPITITGTTSTINTQKKSCAGISIIIPREQRQVLYKNIRINIPKKFLKSAKLFIGGVLTENICYNLYKFYIREFYNNDKQINKILSKIICQDISSIVISYLTNTSLKNIIPLSVFKDGFPALEYDIQIDVEINELFDHNKYNLDNIKATVDIFKYPDSIYEFPITQTLYQYGNRIKLYSKISTIILEISDNNNNDLVIIFNKTYKLTSPICYKIGNKFNVYKFEHFINFSDIDDIVIENRYINLVGINWNLMRIFDGMVGTAY